MTGAWIAPNGETTLISFGEHAIVAFDIAVQDKLMTQSEADDVMSSIGRSIHHAEELLIQNNYVKLMGWGPVPSKPIPEDTRLTKAQIDAIYEYCQIKGLQFLPEIFDRELEKY